MVYTKEQLIEVRNNLLETADNFVNEKNDLAVVLRHASNSLHLAVERLKAECAPVVHSQAILSGWKHCPYCRKKL